MTTTTLNAFWFPLLALLAVEVGMIAVVVELLRRWSSSATWRRTFCQAGLVGVLVLSAAELSGAARWVASRVTGPRNGAPVRRTMSAPPEQAKLSAARTVAATRRSAEGPTESPGAPAPLPTGTEDRELAGKDAGAPSDPLAGRATGASANFFVANDATKLSEPTVSVASVLPSKAPASRVEPAPAPSYPAAFWLLLVWGTGALLIGGRVCLTRGMLMVISLRRRTVADGILRQRVQELARALGMRRRVRVLVSGRLASPAAFGWLWPSVALPEEFSTRMDGTKRDAVLAHELAHLAAHDPFWSLVADAAAVVLWWHPAVWWMRRQLHLANELAADEASMVVADGPRVLAECLVELGARLVQRPLAGQLQMAGFRSHLGRRVQELLRLEGRSWAPPRFVPAALARSCGPAALAVAVVLCTAWAAPRELSKGDSMKTIRQNWKQSLAAFALLASIHGPDVMAGERQGEPAAPPAAEAAPSAGAVAAPAAPAVPEAGRPAKGLIPSTLANRRHSQQIEAKLKGIVFKEVGPWENLPLAEVIKLLSDQARKLDPEGVGVNIVVDYKAPPAVTDQNPGQPPAAPPEAVDLSTIGIKLALPLRNVTLKDLLDIILKAAERPIQYTVEEYGILFSLPSENVAKEPKPGVAAAAAPERLGVRTFKVDTNTIAAALENTFHVNTSPSAQVLPVLRQAFLVLGAKLGDNSLFYNERTGVLMARASRDDLDIIAAVIETLGGVEPKRDPFQPKAAPAGKGSLSELSRQLETLKAERDRLAGTHTSMHPKMVELNDQIEKLREDLKQSDAAAPAASQGETKR